MSAHDNDKNDSASVNKPFSSSSNLNAKLRESTGSKDSFVEGSKFKSSNGNPKPNNGSNRLKSNQNYHDKTHKQRGNYQGQTQRYQPNQNMDEASFAFEESIQDEIISSNYKLKGRKTKISINHLLEFQLPEIEREKNTQGTNYRSKSIRAKESSDHIHLHGDSFINVNYRLLLDNHGEYKEQNIDSNIPVPSEKIFRVIVPKGQNCPICLCEEPVAPRMVTCGHIACYTCLLNFFSIEETIKNPSTGFVKPKKYKDCPLCGSIVRPQHVKPVLFENDLNIHNADGIPLHGTVIKFPLMCRPRQSMLPLPVHLNIDGSKVGNFPSVEAKELAPYAKMMKCSTSYSLELLQKDLDAIQDQFEIDRALYGITDNFAKIAIDEINEKVMNILQNDSEIEPTLVDPISQLSINNFNVKEKYDDSNAFFFYQTAFNSSTKFYLSPLDVKILRETFQNYSNFPDFLEAPVENVHYGTIVTEEFIHRYKYVGYLPLGTEVALIDLDWRKVDLIPKEIINKFIVELKQRRRKFTQKQKREDMQKKIYQNKVEREHAEFYKRENGEIMNYDELIDYVLVDNVQSSEIFQNSLNGILHNDSDEENSPSIDENRTYKETTIWGTSIKVKVDDKTAQENKEFEDMLFQKMQDDKTENDSSNISADNNSGDKLQNGKKGKKSKKSKVLLFRSGGHQTV